MKRWCNLEFLLPPPTQVQGCTPDYHMGVYEDSNTGNICCSGCGQEWVPKPKKSETK